MQAVAPAPPRHQATGKFVYDDDFAVLDDIVFVAQEDGVRLYRLLHVVLPLDGGDVVDVGKAQQLGRLVEALFGKRRAAMFFVDRIIAGSVFLARFLAFDLLAAHELRDNPVDLEILVGGLLAGPGDDQRRAGFVNQDGIDFIDDGVAEQLVLSAAAVGGCYRDRLDGALDTIGQPELHVVAQVIESELVIGPVGDVSVVAVLPLMVVQVVQDGADGQPQRPMDLSHPFGVARGQVVVDRDDVYALAFERIQVGGQRGHQGLAFTCSHFGDLAAVQGDAADQLDVEMAHVHEAAAGFAHYGEGFDEEVVQGRTLSQFFLEFDGLGGEIDIGKRLDARLQVVDRRDDRHHGLDFTLVLGAKDLGQDGINHEELPLSLF